MYIRRSIISAADLQAATTKFTSEKAELERHLQQVQYRIEQFRPAFQGAATTQFVELIAHWNSGADTIRSTLDEINQRLEVVIKAYEDCGPQIIRPFEL